MIMSQNTVKIIIKSFAVLLGVISTFFMAFILCMTTVSLVTDHRNPGFGMLFLIPGGLFFVYIIAVVHSVFKDYTNKSIKNLCILLCILLSLKLSSHFVHNLNDTSIPTRAAYYLLIVVGAPYLAYRILNYLNYKYINQAASCNPTLKDTYET